jgi:multisubunit Na+/H+ antiporter MnhG subunit
MITKVEVAGTVIVLPGATVIVPTSEQFLLAGKVKSLKVLLIVLKSPIEEHTLCLAPCLV